MVIIDDIEQQTEEWYRLKAGVPGASSFDRIVTPTGDPSKSRDDYILELAGERMIGIQEEGYVSWDMRKGIEREDKARACYEYMTDDTIKEVGFVFKDDTRRVGCSPDALIYDLDDTDLLDPVSGLEVKCPKLRNQVSQLLNGGLPPDKVIQIQGCMWVCGFHSWEFISYFPGMDPYILNVKRNYKFTSALEEEMIMFLDELDEVYDKLIRR